MALTMDFDPLGQHRQAHRETSLEAARRRAFTAARRHTFAVRLMRLTFPIAAVGVIAAYALAIAMNFSFGVGNLRVGPVEVTADDLTMRNPSYFGVTQDGGRYEVRAKRAVLELNQNAPVKLFEGELGIGSAIEPAT